MYILKNALKSISRSKGRNILIGIIVAVIATASCISLSIKNAATEAEVQGTQLLNVTATISVDRQKLMSSVKSGSQDDIRTLMQKYTGLSLEEMQKYAKSSYVKNFVYSLSSSMSASGSLKPYSESSTNSTSSTSGNGQQASKGNANRTGFGRMGMQGDFTVTGYSTESAMTAFVKGTSKITSGSLFNIGSSDSTCIISKDLATFNGLKIGDKITLANPNKTEETYELTVAGIYTNSDSSSTSSGMMRFSTAQDSANQIYTSYSSLKAVTAASTANAVTSTDSSTGEVTTTALREQTSGTYMFENTAALENFRSDVTKMGLNSNYTVTSNDETSYEQSLVPLKNLSKFASTLLIIVLFIGAVILIVFNIFNIRERKFEVGVLTAIGMKKGKVALQFISELFIVTFIALIIGTAAGSAISVPTANAMLQSQITQQKSATTQQDTNFGRQSSQGSTQNGGNTSMFGVFGRNAQNVNYLSTINAVTNLPVVGELMGIGILLTMLSSCAAASFVMRYEPLKILSNRS
jgi:putative ABC transport system permease protein